mgnify:CR=1 FL=1
MRKQTTSWIDQAKRKAALEAVKEVKDEIAKQKLI